MVQLLSLVKITGEYSSMHSVFLVFQNKQVSPFCWSLFVHCEHRPYYSFEELATGPYRSTATARWCKYATTLEPGAEGDGCSLHEGRSRKENLACSQENVICRTFLSSPLTCLNTELHTYVQYSYSSTIQVIVRDRLICASVNPASRIAFITFYFT